MKIGLDFDNTLACYNKVFLDEAKKLKYLPIDWTGDKQSIKSEILKFADGDTKWQRLQGIVYGPAMSSAVLFPGVASFLLRAKERGNQIIIVSHKTKYGHQDETRTPLREKALQWMENKDFFDTNGFGILRTNVYFCDSREEKVMRIKDLKIDLFVDDLECVFEEREFPSARKILFRSPPSSSFKGVSCASWSEVSEDVLGSIQEEDCKALLDGVMDDEIKNIRPIFSGTNSKVFTFCNSEGKPYVLKLYPNLTVDKRPRLETEMKALKNLVSYGMTPKAITFDHERNLSVLEFLPGEPPQEITQGEIRQALSFVKTLHLLAAKTPEQFELASEACLSASEIERQIHVRLGKLQKIRHHELNTFLSDDFQPLLQETLSWAKSLLADKANWIKELSLEKRTLSPADFGFHNSIQDPSGQLKFIDLEYFGWDEPTKLIAEFMLHPGMNLNQECKERWLEGCLSIFGANDSDLPLRLRVSTPLYALRWCLITLNPFLGFSKRSSARGLSPSFVDDKELSGQILKAKRLCSLSKPECLPSYA